MKIYKSLLQLALIRFTISRSIPNKVQELLNTAQSSLNNLEDELSNFASQSNGFNRNVVSETYWLDQMDHTGSARGFAPFIQGDFTYPVYRNVKSSPYNAVGDGSADDTTAIQNAINDDGSNGSRFWNSLSTRPAQVFIPRGTYILTSRLDIPLNTILVGDPNDPPILKASNSFSGDTLIDAHQNNPDHGELNFFVAVKNIQIDTTAFNKDSSLTALNWAVAQACQLANVNITMPFNSGGHTGISMFGGSATAFGNVNIQGGNIGIAYANQQINLKQISFFGCTTAIRMSGGKTVVVQKATFNTVSRCIDASSSGHLGSINIIDCTVTNSGEVIRFDDSSNWAGDRNNQIVIENLKHDGVNPIAVRNSDSKPVLPSMSNGDTWVWGNVDPWSPAPWGRSGTTNRSPSLLDSSGNYFTMAQPSYANYSAAEVLNVKAFPGFPVMGDGRTDDSASLNAILAHAASQGMVAYVPYGVYVLRSQLLIPHGTRMVGEAWPVFSGVGSAFGDASNPVPVVMVGRPGEVGVAQIQDMRFSVADIAPGAIVLQVNMKGENPGDVGLWNSHVTVGGFTDSNVDHVCGGGDPAACKAAFALVHLSASSSAYIENMWGWTADHSLDGALGGVSWSIATGRGMLVEATQATWLTGTAFEHNTLYNYNFHSASNVYAGMQQCETPYWQGNGSPRIAPDPWVANSAYGDPDFSWCAGNDASCRVALAVNVDSGSNIYLFGAAFWTFFNNHDTKLCDSGACITNQARVTNNPQNFYWYGVSERSAATMILDGHGDPNIFNNPGGWSPGGVIAAYMIFSGTTLQSSWIGEVHEGL